MCNKLDFNTKGEVKAYIRNISKYGNRINTKLYPYNCLECEFWHMTSTTSKARKSVANKMKKTKRNHDLCVESRIIKFNQGE